MCSRVATAEERAPFHRAELLGRVDRHAERHALGCRPRGQRGLEEPVSDRALDQGPAEEHPDPAPGPAQVLDRR